MSHSIRGARSRNFGKFRGCCQVLISVSGPAVRRVILTPRRTRMTINQVLFLARPRKRIQLLESGLYPFRPTLRRRLFGGAVARALLQPGRKVFARHRRAAMTLVSMDVRTIQRFISLQTQNRL